MQHGMRSVAGVVHDVLLCKTPLLITLVAKTAVDVDDSWLRVGTQMLAMLFARRMDA